MIDTVVNEMKNNSRQASTHSISKKVLQENNIFYKHLLEITPEAIVIHSGGKIVYINPTAVKMIGAKSEKELLGRSVMDFIHPDSQSLIKERITSMLSKQKVAPFVEEKFIGVGGDIIIAETKAVPFMYQGKPAILAILHEITDKKKKEERQKFLDTLSKLLGTSIDYRTTLDNISRSIVPALADYGRIILVDDNKHISEIYAHHANPKKLKEVEKLYNAYKNDSGSTYGVDHILQTGKSEIMSLISSQTFKSFSTNKNVQNIVNELNLKSYMGVPLKIKNKVIGAITFSSTRQDRTYTKDDLVFAEEVARRVASAIENARIFLGSQKSLEAEERLSAIVSFSDDAIISKTINGIITSWNKGAERMFGYTAKEAIGKPMTITIPKELRGEEKEIIKRIKKGLHIEHYETTRIRKDGERISVSISISAIKDKRNVIGASNITRDITEKKKIENELVHLASLVESSSDAIWSRSLDNRVLSWNKGAEKMYGYTAKEVLGKKIDTLVVPFDKYAELEKITKRVVKGESIQSIESIRITKEKKKIDVSMTLSPLKDPQGQVVGVSAIVRNISQQKEQEKLKDEFISMASHELKTPITSMKMFLDILHNYLSKDENFEALGYVNRIKDQANKIRDLVNDLLDVSRIETGKMRFNNENFFLDEILRDTIDGMQPAVRKHELLFNQNEKIVVYGDRFRIYQVITNLLNNAVKYSPKKDKIIITAKKIKNEAVVSVKDFGIGIPKDKHQKIFEKLYQVTDPEVKTFPGLGMGLYISNEIIKRHSGKMWVSSQKGKGSTFFFSLPLAQNKEK
ncbi:MAG TPA: PAS domain S-box protein [Candidatus Saccharimonadales bacterium]|nr:PAS domain S-box protein [Candidatus Saccharimonadales bacterium]